jgi:nucleoside-diphosphate-sugar epimerase
VFNIGGTVPITINRLAHEVMASFAEYAPSSIVYLPARPCEVKQAWCTWARSRRGLGFEESIGWREGIRRMAAWAKRCGPQAWAFDDLPLLNDKAPVTWSASAEVRA